jgi:FXSXX-COOH protein
VQHDLLIDVTRIPLEKLAQIDSAVLRRAVERVRREAEDPVCAFNSAI